MASQCNVYPPLLLDVPANLPRFNLAQILTAHSHIYSTNLHIHSPCQLRLLSVNSPWRLCASRVLLIPRRHSPADRFCSLIIHLRYGARLRFCVKNNGGQMRSWNCRSRHIGLRWKAHPAAAWQTDVRNLINKMSRWFHRTPRECASLHTRRCSESPLGLLNVAGIAGSCVVMRRRLDTEFSFSAACACACLRIYIHPRPDWESRRSNG